MYVPLFKKECAARNQKSNCRDMKTELRTAGNAVREDVLHKSYLMRATCRCITVPKLLILLLLRTPIVVIRKRNMMR